MKELIPKYRLWYGFLKRQPSTEVLYDEISGKVYLNGVFYKSMTKKSILQIAELSTYKIRYSKPSEVIN